MEQEQAGCAHKRVIHKPIKNENGTYFDRWVCDSCGMEFIRALASRPVSDGFCCEGAEKLHALTDANVPLSEYSGKCSNCGCDESYTYWVPENLWRHIVPEKLWNGIVCAKCFHAFATSRPVSDPEQARKAAFIAGYKYYRQEVGVVVSPFDEIALQTAERGFNAYLAAIESAATSKSKE